ncbi:hypothetical protein [Massilia sp. erpn]|uniref:hypothetical protein n=1 Tax=Massilia sp. erpn TaxID=2738142 RepID=UPI002104228A|nr:hypothetical protein [Massilia sp. erpn]UTY59469.1 hypothetical protein HPQ68_21200 [Massilia sp. erpn]
MKQHVLLAALALTVMGAQAQKAAVSSSDIAPDAPVKPGVVSYIGIDELSAPLKAAAMKDLQANALAERRTYAHIPDEAVRYRKNYAENIKNFGNAKTNLTFKLADIQRSQLANYKYEGIVPDGPTKQGPWSRINRVFVRPDGVVVMLYEWDYPSDDGGISIVKELMNTSVGSVPARYSVAKSPSGDVVTELLWVEKDKYFTITVLGEVPNNDRSSYNLSWLRNIASSIR